MNQLATTAAAIPSKMYRTRWPACAFCSNTSALLYISLSHCRVSIDRVKFVINHKYYNAVKSILREQFEPFGRTALDMQTGITIQKLKRDNSLIQLVRGSLSYNFAVQIHDVTRSVWDEVLSALCMAVDPSDKVNAIKLSQCELAMDFYPADGVSLETLAELLFSSVSMKNAQLDAINIVHTTAYLGTDGNVRNGSKGLRCYPKPEIGAYRIELQANRKLLKQFDLFADGFSPLAINPRQYIQFRQALSDHYYQLLFKAICKKKGVDTTKYSQLSNTMLEKRIYMSEFLCMNCDKYVDCYRIGDEGMPVACQINAFKAVKKRFGLSQQLDALFPRTINV
jgi:hypothetical protein